MDRRTALKHFAVAGAASMLLPGCLTDKRKVSVALNNLQVTPDDEELLAEIADTIIPSAGEKPGAKQVGAHLFTFVMVDDCLPPSEKEKFMNGLRSFNKSVSEEGAFMKMDADEKLQALLSFEKKGETAEQSLREFYRIAKDLIIRGYTSSQYFLTEVKPYKLVPGPVFKGCVPLSENV
jgi:hypothetical protein